MNWADAYERISGVLKDLREAHAMTVTRNAVLTAELTEARAHLVEEANRVTAALDERNRARSELADAGIELELRVAQHEVVEAELRRRIINQSHSLGYPRLEDVVEIHQLKGELARTRLISVLREQALQKSRAELEEALSNTQEEW